MHMLRGNHSDSVWCQKLFTSCCCDCQSIIYSVVTIVDWLCKVTCEATSRMSMRCVACAACTAAGGTLVSAAAGGSTAACEPPASDQGACSHQQRGEGGLPSHVPTKDSPRCILFACCCPSVLHILWPPPSLGTTTFTPCFQYLTIVCFNLEKLLKGRCNMLPFLTAWSPATGTDTCTVYVCMSCHWP